MSNWARDDFGNVTGTLLDSVTVGQRVTYDGNGLPAVTGDQTNRLMWKGAPYDKDLGARWYDPYVMRFISEDPLGLAGGINPYVFANDDAVNGSDPSGMSEEITCWYVAHATAVMGKPDGGFYYELVCDGGGGDDGSLPALAPADGVSTAGSVAGGHSDVEKHYPKTIACKANATDVMSAVKENFARFGDYSMGPLNVTFSPPSVLKIGSTIPIAVVTGPVTTSMSVTVYAMTSQSVTFVTSPGHLLYPAAITFSAENASSSSVSFHIDVAGSFPSAINQAKFYGGGSGFEDAQWNHFLTKIGGLCKAGS